MDFDFYNFFLVFVRTGAFLLALPFFSAVNVPVMMRIALAAFASLLIAPQLPPFPVERMDLISLSACWCGKPASACCSALSGG